MLNKSILTISSVLLLLFQSCIKDDEIDDSCLTVDIPQNLLTIVVTDSINDNLIGKNNVYHPDSILLFKNNNQVPFSLNNTNQLTLSYRNFSNMDTLYLKLNNNEVDTLTFDLSSVDYPCYDSLRINALYQNRILVSYNSAVKAYPIIK